MINKDKRLAALIIATIGLLLIILPLERSGSVSSTVNFLVPFVTTVAIFAIVCIGLNVQWGYAGIFNFGVLAFFMLGAYTAMIVTKSRPDSEFVEYIGGYGEILGSAPLPYASEWFPHLVGLIAAALVAGLLALILGATTLHLREDYLAITIIGVAEILRRVVIEEPWLFNGTRGIGGVPRPFAGVIESTNYKYFFLFVALAFLALTFAMVELGIRSPWGRVLRALREDEDATSASGKSVFNFKNQSFVFGSMIIGMGGAIYVYLAGSGSPDTFTHFFGTFIFWAMLIVGGSGNNWGAVAGAFIVWGIWSIALQIQGYDLPDLIQSRIFAMRDFLIGLIIIIVLLFNPRGLLPEQVRVSRWLDRRVATFHADEREASKTVGDARTRAD